MEEAMMLLRVGQKPEELIRISQASCSLRKTELSEAQAWLQSEEMMSSEFHSSGLLNLII
jgi:hypothetical protein